VVGETSVNLVAGMNLITSFSASNLSSELQELMKSVGLPSNSKIPLAGKISPNIFKNILTGPASSASSSLMSSSQMKLRIQSLLTKNSKTRNNVPQPTSNLNGTPH
jgi:hypothetical protein